MGKIYTVYLSNELGDKLEAFCQEHGITPYRVIKTSCMEFLHRCSERPKTEAEIGEGPDVETIKEEALREHAEKVIKVIARVHEVTEEVAREVSNAMDELKLYGELKTLPMSEEANMVLRRIMEPKAYLKE